MNPIEYFLNIPTFIKNKLTQLGTGLQKYIPQAEPAPKLNIASPSPQINEQDIASRYQQKQISEDEANALLNNQTLPTPSPTPNTIPSGTGLAMNYIQSQTPQGQPLEQYYPALGNQQFVQGINESDQLRQGLANLLLLQGFFESTLGRGGQALFGAIPNANQPLNFNDPAAALDYQLSPNVLGGGANPNMNILGARQPLTTADIEKLYQSYDPQGAYLETLLRVLGGE